MVLTPGTQLGPYEITAALGAGGMGEVYRARDKRLERIVAIKILPRQYSADLFFAYWKNGDQDIPILKQAKAEYAKLH